MPVNGAVLYEFMQWNNKCCLTILTATNIRCQAHHSFNKMDSFLEAFEYLLTLKIIVVGSCTFFSFPFFFFFLLGSSRTNNNTPSYVHIVISNTSCCRNMVCFHCLLPNKNSDAPGKEQCHVLQWTLQTENAILLRSQSKNAAAETQNVLLKLFNYKCMSPYRLCLMSAKAKPLLAI